MLKPGGRLIVNLPAHNPLRSEHHLSASINRRHTTIQVAEELERVGLIVEQIAHANIMPFPIAGAVGIARKWPPKPSADRRSGVIPLPPVVDHWPTKAHSLETLPLQKGHLPYGLLVICVACKEPAIP